MVETHHLGSMADYFKVKGQHIDHDIIFWCVRTFSGSAYTGTLCGQPAARLPVRPHPASEGGADAGKLLWIMAPAVCRQHENHVCKFHF